MIVPIEALGYVFLSHLDQAGRRKNGGKAGIAGNMQVASRQGLRSRRPALKTPIGVGLNLRFKPIPIARMSAFTFLMIAVGTSAQAGLSSDYFLQDGTTTLSILTLSPKDSRPHQRNSCGSKIQGTCQ
jgi:hypothetical protein